MKDLKFDVRISVSENLAGIGTYEDAVSVDNGEPERLQIIGYERKGFDPDDGKAGTITITSLKAMKSGDAYIPEEITCKPDWSKESVTAPVTAIAPNMTLNYELDDRGVIGCIFLPNTLRSVGRCAFVGYCDMQSVRIPESVAEIGEFAFGYYSADPDGDELVPIEDFTVYCYKDTAGERYAKENGFKYKVFL